MKTAEISFDLVEAREYVASKDPKSKGLACPPEAYQWLLYEDKGCNVNWLALRRAVWEYYGMNFDRML